MHEIRPQKLGYFDNYLIDNESCVIVGVQATAARLSQESAAARDMIDRYCERYGRRPKGVAADNTYGNGEMLRIIDSLGLRSNSRTGMMVPVMRLSIIGLLKLGMCTIRNAVRL